MAEQSVEPCSCAGMNTFSAPLNKDSLKESAGAVLPRDLPKNPSEAANKINGVRDKSLTEAQTATINVSLTKQKLDNLPDVVKERPAVKAMSGQLTDVQTNLLTQSAETQSLSAKLTSVEKQRDALRAEKTRIEEQTKASMPVPSNVKDQAFQNATDSAEYRSFQGYKAGAADVRGNISPAALQGALAGSEQYQSVLGDISALDEQHTKLLTQYTSARDSLNGISASTKNELPDISKNIDLLQQQYDSMQFEPSKLLVQQLPNAPQVPTDTANILNVALNTLDSNGKLSSMFENMQGQLPALPPSSGMSAMPALPAMPQFPKPTIRDGIEYIKLPMGLKATPALPAMPSYPGTDALPAVPETFIDKSIETIINSHGADTSVLSKAQNYASTVKLSDVQAYFTSESKSHADATSSALKQTSNGYLTKALEAMPAVPARPALPAFPRTADLTKFAGVEIPTLPSLRQHADKISPDKMPFYTAVWTEIDAKRAARDRVVASVKERTASSHTAVMGLVDAQKQATLERIPVGQYLESKSGTNPIYAAIKAQTPSSFAAGFSSLPETPLECKKNCKNAQIRNLFPDVSSPAKMQIAAVFADANKLMAEPAVHVISVGASADAYAQGHIGNLQRRVQEAGGKTVTVFPEDIKEATTNPAAMLKLEDSLKGVSMVSMPNVENLSPQEAMLVNGIAKDMSTSVPVIMTTPSIGSLAAPTDGSVESIEGAREINSAMIGQLAPAGSLDARSPHEIPQKTVYDNPNNDTVEESAEFKGLFNKYKS